MSLKAFCVCKNFRYIAQIDDLLSRGAPGNGIGIQAHLGPALIDLGKAEDTFNRLYSQFNFPIWITEFDWKDQPYGECTEIEEDHSQHAIELDNFFRLCLRFVVVYKDHHHL